MQEESPPARGVTAVRRLVRLFFREVEVAGLDNLPETGGGLIVSWHPNGMIDPALIVTHFPRRVCFGARHGLFRWPLLGRLMTSLGTVPIYRRGDRGPTDEARRDGNRESLDRLAEAVAAGSFAALFPEGVSHDESSPRELKTGAARLFYRASELAPSDRPPVILPIGLHYNHKRTFGSRALVAIHPPLALPPELVVALSDEDEESRRRRCRRLTEEIERALHRVVHATESWELHDAMQRASKLIRAERGLRAGARLDPASMGERVAGMARLWAGYRDRVKSHPAETKELFEAVKRYDEDIRALGLSDEDLDAPPPVASPWLPVILVSQAVLVYLLLPPLLMIGYLVNLPPALVALGLAKVASKKEKDEATVKLLASVLLFPLSWLVVAVATTLGEVHLRALFPTIPRAPLVTALLAILLSAASAWLLLHYQRLLRRTMRALKVRLTRARRSRTIEKLRRERARLFDQLMALAEGLELPGQVAPDGRVTGELFR